MTRPDPVAAALENGMNATVAWRSVRLTYNDLERAGDVMAEFIETTLARLLREREANTSNSSKGSTKPAAPAVGEDAGADCECTCASELAEKVRVLLADVARLTEERNSAVDSAVVARSGHANAMMDLDLARRERDEARATLAAVRKIADDYHDVDVTGDPPREVACNPCANDILNVLEGRKP